jgi:hypothetical protein
MLKSGVGLTLNFLAWQLACCFRRMRLREGVAFYTSARQTEDRKQ